MADAAGADAEPLYLTREEAAKVHGKSLPTVDRWIADGGDQFVVEHGGPGRPYKIDALKLMAYLQGVKASEAEQDLRRREQIAQLEIGLTGGEDRTAVGGLVLTAEQRIKVWQEQILANKLRRERGELLELSAVERAYENRMKLVAEFHRGLPDMLARQLGWDAATTEICAGMVEALQERFAKMMMTELIGG